MSATSVGRIGLDLVVNQNQFNKQMKGITGIAKKAGAVIAGAFAVKKIFDFGKAAMALGSDLAEVQNVVDVTFSRMSGKIDAFAKGAAAQFGLSETMAKKFSGTFGAMSKAFGFSEQQAYDMSTALTGLAGDVASFYNIAQGEAYTKLKSVFTGETETLKDLGVVMTQSALDAYAMANGYGKTTAKMSEAEKVALRFKFVQEQLSLANGDFARTSGSWANQVRILKLQMESFMATVGQGLINIFTPVIKVINSLMSKLISLANLFKAFTEAITGKSGTGVKDTAQDAASSLSGVGGAASGAAADTKKAAKEIKGALAGFDELNVLQQPASGSGETDAGGGGGVSGMDFETDATPGLSEEDLGLADRIAKKIAELTSGIRAVDFSGVKESFNGLKEAAGRFLDTLMNIDLEPLSEALGEVVEAATPLVATLFDGLAWFLDNIAGPLAVWGAEVLLPAILRLIASALGVLNSVVEAAKPALLWLWEEFLKPTAEWAGELLVSALGWLREKLDALSEWVDSHSEGIKQFIEIVALLGAGFLAVRSAVTLVHTAVTGLQAIFAVLASPAGAIAVVIGLIAALVVAMGNGEEMVNTLKGAFDALRDFISNVFAGDWEEAWISVKKIFGNVFNGIVIIAESAVNLLIKGINWLIEKINTIKIDMPGWVEDMFGVGSIGFNLPKLTEVKLPRTDISSIGAPALATGAVIPPNSEFLAVLGDQKNGRNLEAPEGLLREIVQEGMAGQPAQNNQPIEIHVILDGKTLARLLVPYLDAAQNRRGGTLIKGVT